MTVSFPSLPLGAAASGGQGGSGGGGAEGIVEEREVAGGDVQRLLEDVVQKELASNDGAGPDASRGQPTEESSDAVVARDERRRLLQERELIDASRELAHRGGGAVPLSHLGEHDVCGL